MGTLGTHDRAALALASMVVVALAITPLRETLSWASRSRPEPDQIRAELNTALEQIYRSFELDDEAATYDQIAQSVTGDAIREIYLEVRRSLSDQGRWSRFDRSCPSQRH